VAGAVAVVVYFIWFAGASVRAGFSHDDLMNMHSAFVERTLWGHIERSFLFFLPATRPLGATLYRLVYHATGLNPLLLHATCFSLALLNICLLFFVTAKISGSREIGLLAALIGAFHDNFLPLYYNSGMCYDLLSFALFYLALWLYASMRERRRLPGLFENAVILMCFALALGVQGDRAFFSVSPDRVRADLGSTPNSQNHVAVALQPGTYCASRRRCRNSFCRGQGVRRQRPRAH